MRYYSRSEIMHDLHISNHRLYRLLEIACIDTHGNDHDRRLRLITEDEYARIKAEHEASHAALGLATDTTATHGALITQIAALEAEIARMRRQEIQPKSMAGDEARPVIGHGGFPQEPVPAGYVYLRTFAEAHGVPKVTAMRHVERGNIHEEVRPVPARPDTIHHYLTPEQQQEAVMFWRRNRGGLFRECDNPLCGCHVL